MRAIAILLMPVILLTSCNRYIDCVKTSKTIPVSQGEMTYAKDENLLVYKSTMKYKQDSQILSAKNFAVSLPKGIKNWSASNSERFYFYYSYRQAVLINIDLESTVSKKDTVYIPDADEVRRLIDKEIIGTKEKYNINKINLEPSRKQTIIQRGNATILLYNIKSDMQANFLKSLNSFKFIQ